MSWLVPGCAAPPLPFPAGDAAAVQRGITVHLAAVQGGRAEQVLDPAGLDEATARSAYGALHTYTIGFAALEASRSGWVPDRENVSSLAQQLAAYTTTGQFVAGLRHLLEGIGRHARPGMTSQSVSFEGRHTGGD